MEWFLHDFGALVFFAGVAAVALVVMFFAGIVEKVVGKRKGTDDGPLS